MRQDILEALELWPLWTLRGETASVDVSSTSAVSEALKTAETGGAPVKPKVKPSAKAALERFRQAGKKTAPAPKPEVVREESTREKAAVDTTPNVVANTAAPTAVEASYQLLVSDDGQCLLVHDSQPLSQEASQLRHNMAKAMQRNIKPIQDAKTAAQVLAQYQPVVVVLFGEKTAQTLLDVEETLADLRGMELVLGDYACVVSYDFNHLLENPQDKRNAWEDLCLALDVLKASA